MPILIRRHRLPQFAVLQLGPRFYTLVKEFIDNQDHYRELYNDYLLTQQ